MLAPAEYKDRKRFFSNVLVMFAHCGRLYQETGFGVPYTVFCTSKGWYFSEITYSSFSEMKLYAGTCT